MGTQKISKKKIIIISVPYTEPMPMVAPVLLSACLSSAGIEAKGIDFSVMFLNKFIHKPYWPELKNLLALGIKPSLLPRRALIDVLKFIRHHLLDIKRLYDPDYIGLSIFTNESINFSYILLPYIRKYLPGTKIILGGRGLELRCGVENRPHYEKYHDHGMADLIIIGDAETALIDAIKSHATGIYFSKQQAKEDLDNIPVPSWQDYDFDLYKPFETYAIQEDQHRIGEDPRYVSVTASKGCVRNCTFCDVASFWPRYIYRSGEKVAAEIIENYQFTKIKNFVFSDNLMNGSISEYHKMNLVLAEKIPNTIKYKGYAIFRNKAQMKTEDFELARLAGCDSWAIGIESGSEKVRFDMKKKFTDEDMDHGIVNLHKNFIKQSWLFITGYPTETDEDFEDTIALLQRYAHLNSNKMIRVSITPTFAVLHNSPLIQDDKLKQQLGLDYDINDNLSRYFWTAKINPDNDFAARYHRFNRLMDVAIKLNYTFSQGMPVSKWRAEIENMKKIYDETRSKKVFPILVS
jgi:radical SAM superfamily enzyme YgiQ (UPF0313 family)